MKYLLPALFLIGATQAHALALECVSVQDPSVKVTVTKNPPGTPPPIIEFGVRNRTMRVFHGEVLVKEELVVMHLGIASNFYSGDTLYLDDGMFKNSATFYDRELDTGFAVDCTGTNAALE